MCMYACQYYCVRGYSPLHPQTNSPYYHDFRSKSIFSSTTTIRVGQSRGVTSAFLIQILHQNKIVNDNTNPMLLFCRILGLRLVQFWCVDLGPTNIFLKNLLKSANYKSLVTVVWLIAIKNYHPELYS